MRETPCGYGSFGSRRHRGGLRRSQYERAVVVHVIEVVPDPGPNVIRAERFIGVRPFGDDSENLVIGVLAEDVEDLRLSLKYV